jgi:hypothetical protein
MRSVFALSFIFGFFLASISFAGDEDVKPKEEKKEVVEQAPAEEPEAPEAPNMSLGEEPEPEGPSFPSDRPKKQTKKKMVMKSPDENLDYSEILDFVDPLELKKGVLPPALGARGYRPNLVAGSYGDRTPGYGGILEYSWNRLSAGVFYAYRNVTDYDRFSYSQSFVGFYGLYRWLPFSVSPYILLGLEFGKATPVGFGGMAGLGLETRIYSGWTVLLGYTYHSTARKGFFGGAFGWSF